MRCRFVAISQYAYITPVLLHRTLQCFQDLHIMSWAATAYLSRGQAGAAP